MKAVLMGTLTAALLLVATDASAWCCAPDRTKTLLQNFKWEGGKGGDIVPFPPVPGVPGHPEIPVPDLPGVPGAPATPWRLPPVVGGSIGGGGEQPGGGENLPPPPPPGGGIGVPGTPSAGNLNVKPYADYDFWTRYAFTDWHNRIVSAYIQGRAMWHDETNINLVYSTPEAASFNFPQYDGNDGGLGTFTGWVVAQKMTGFNSYALFQAYNEPDWNAIGYGGLGYTHDDDTFCHTLAYQTTPPENGYCPSNMIVAKDWHTSDTYNPDDMWQLALSANHELTHNAGEWEHPMDDIYCNNNLMQNMVAHWCKDMYRLSSTVGRVRSYSYSRMR